jgi:hypothetical protein
MWHLDEDGLNPTREIGSGSKVGLTEHLEGNPAVRDGPLRQRSRKLIAIHCSSVVKSANTLTDASARPEQSHGISDAT